MGIAQYCVVLTAFLHSSDVFNHCTQQSQTAEASGSSEELNWNPGWMKIFSESLSLVFLLAQHAQSYIQSGLRFSTLSAIYVEKELSHIQLLQYSGLPLATMGYPNIIQT